MNSLVPERREDATTRRVGRNYNISLLGTENGVVTRFPPEPSGYLHIGHVKPAILNDYFAHDAYDGKLIVRFDDTNPSRNQGHGESILHDLDLLGIKPDQVTYTSDYFSRLYDIAEQMIRDGHAYADDNDHEAIIAERMQGLPSKRRDRPSEGSLALFKEMQSGTPLGRKNCIRARIKFDSNNVTLRDPIMYQFYGGKDAQGNLLDSPISHHRTGSTWNIYPTYDFACPILDSIEGVTHALRGSEYAERNEQYSWFLNTLGLRQVQLWSFARSSFTRTILSKRKLTKLVDSGVVTGWDDPRMPTVRGMLRRGLTVLTLREFMLRQGSSRNAVMMNRSVLWAMNEEVIDPVAPYHTAVETRQVVTASILNGPDTPYSEHRPRHPKDPTLGTKVVTYGPTILLNYNDAASLAIGEEITLIGWGNAIVKECNISGDGTLTDVALILCHNDTEIQKAKEIVWLASQGASLVQVELWEFDDFLTKDNPAQDDDFEDYLATDSARMTRALCDADVARLGTGDIIQLEQKGFYRVDRAVGKGPKGRAVMFKIPPGSTA